MYKEGYVAVVKYNGNIIEEDSSKRILLPFGAEYEVRLINKSIKNCATDLTINGEKIGRFFLEAGQNMDIERYLDGDNNKGKKFKFTHLNDSGVKSKTDIDNGFIEVSFYPEKKKDEPIIIKEHHYHHYDPIPPYVHPAPNVPFPRPWSPLFDGTRYAMDMGCTNDIGKSYGGMAMNCSSPAPIEGATVRGSESKQSFTSVYGKEFDSIATVIRLKIFNGEVVVTNKYCSGCGRKKKYGDKYCANCGKEV